MPEQFVYKIVDNKTGEPAGAYSRSYHTEYEFSSVSGARFSNINGTFLDKRRYRIQKWKVTYELIEDDIDPYMQVKIPYYKDYLKEKDFREAMNASTNKMLEEAFKSLHAAIGLLPETIKDIIEKDEARKNEEIEKMNREYKGTSLKKFSRELNKLGKNEDKLTRKLRKGWK